MITALRKTKKILILNLRSCLTPRTAEILEEPLCGIHHTKDQLEKYPLVQNVVCVS
jgi:hypothetical protein